MAKVWLISITMHCGSETHHVEQLWTFNRDEVEAWFIGHCLSGDNTVRHSETVASSTLSGPTVLPSWSWFLGRITNTYFLARKVNCVHSCPNIDNDRKYKRPYSRKGAGTISSWRTARFAQHLCAAGCQILLVSKGLGLYTKSSGCAQLFDAHSHCTRLFNKKQFQHVTPPKTKTVLFVDAFFLLLYAKLS